ncbi:MAG: sensor histidine kinase [Acidimicrobiia bacterium]
MATGNRFAEYSRRFRETEPWVFDAFLGTAFTVFGLIGLLTTHSTTIDYRPADAFSVVLALACSLPYYVRRRAPATVLSINVVALCVMAIIGYPANVQSQMILVGIYTVGAHSTGRGRVLGPLAVGLGLTTVAIAGIPDATTANLLFSGAVYAGGFLFGSTVRNRRLYNNELEARTVALERERDEEAKRALSEERLRIAQELHDVVAHSMGVIAVQAGVGAHVIDQDPAEAKRSLEAIAGTSRSTLREIRRILGVLRDDGAAAYQPAPGLADLDHLVADFDVAGLPVEVAVDGTPTELPAGVDLTAYRIVQEALTNVLKHAGPARAAVTIAYRPGSIALRITDDGRGVNGRASDGGHGLLGMRERVGVYGGSLTAGPQPGGGFRVLAELPYEEES